MSGYYLELFTSDRKSVIKDSEGNIVSDEPLAREEALAALKKLNKVQPVAEKKKKVKKSKKVKADEEK